MTSNGVPIPDRSRKLTRRSLLTTASIVLVGGCVNTTSSDEGETYRLDGRPVADDLADEFLWEPSGPHAGHDQELLSQLLEDETLTTTGFALHSPNAETPAYVDHGDEYYRLEAHEGDRVERKRWIVWFELLDDSTPPPDATVVEYDDFPTNVSEVASRDDPEYDILNTAFPMGERGPQDVSGNPPASRGHVFHRYSTDETPLLPEPSFTHVRVEWRDETSLLRANVDETTVETQEIVHEATPEFTSGEDFRAHLEDEFVATRFEAEALDDDEREIVDAITRRRESATHEEEAPLSEEFESILDRLRIPVPESSNVNGGVFSDWSYFEYEDALYRARLEIL